MSTRTLHVVSEDRDEGLVEALRHGESSAAERLSQPIRTGRIGWPSGSRAMPMTPRRSFRMRS
jgi:hypothetical protein